MDKNTLQALGNLSTDHTKKPKVVIVIPRYTVHGGGNGTYAIYQNAQYIEFSNLRGKIGAKRTYNQILSFIFNVLRL